jgi:hypothetical protein
MKAPARARSEADKSPAPVAAAHPGRHPGAASPSAPARGRRGSLDDDDREAFAAGRRIAAASRDRRDILTIRMEDAWPRPVEAGAQRRRGDRRLARPGDSRTERAAAAVLTGLADVEVPVASAVMTAVAPEALHDPGFPRVRSQLGVERKTYYSVGYYLEYLSACRRIAGGRHRPTHTALRQYSSEHQPGHLGRFSSSPPAGPSEGFTQM